MLKQIILGSITAIVSVSALAETQCNYYPENQRLDPVEFQNQLRRQGYQIRQFKISEGNCYEIYARNNMGQRVEIYFDAKTGRPVKSEIDD